MRTNKNNNELRNIVANFKRIKEDYRPQDGVMAEDSPRIHALKGIIYRRLSVSDRTLLILYAETNSLRKVGALMGVSHQSVKNEIQRIRKEVLSCLQN